MSDIYINELGQLVHISGGLVTDIDGLLSEDMWLFYLR